MVGNTDEHGFRRIWETDSAAELHDLGRSDLRGSGFDRSAQGIHFVHVSAQDSTTMLLLGIKITVIHTTNRDGNAFKHS